MKEIKLTRYDYQLGWEEKMGICEDVSVAGYDVESMVSLNGNILGSFGVKIMNSAVMWLFWWEIQWRCLSGNISLEVRKEIWATGDFWKSSAYSLFWSVEVIVLEIELKGRMKKDKLRSIQKSNCCLATKSCPTLQTHGLQHARLPCPSLSPRVCSNSCLLSWGCHPTILSSSPPALSLSQPQGLFQRVSSSHQVAKVLELQLQHQSFWWIFGVDFL